MDGSGSSTHSGIDLERDISQISYLSEFDFILHLPYLDFCQGRSLDGLLGTF